jgi:hypothetical protein
MQCLRTVVLLFAEFIFATGALAGGDRGTPLLPNPGQLVIDRERGELVLAAVVQYPKGKPCIDEYGERVQAFVGSKTAAGDDATMAGYFVFLTDAPTEDVHKAMLTLGCKPRVHYGIQEGKKRSGLREDTRPED